MEKEIQSPPKLAIKLLKAGANKNAPASKEYTFRINFQKTSRKYSFNF